MDFLVGKMDKQFVKFRFSPLKDGNRKVPLIEFKKPDIMKKLQRVWIL